MQAPLRLPFILLLLAGCAAPPPLPSVEVSPGAGAETVSLIVHGWHTDIGLPAPEISGPLTTIRALYPGARTLVFGYGKRTFMIAPAHTIGEWIIGPFPGPAAVEVSAISSDSATAYGRDHVMTLALPPGGGARLSAFLWQALARGPSGKPIFIAQGNWPGSLFYAASAPYALNHTCNRWSAEALASGGLPINPDGVIFSGQIERAARAVVDTAAAEHSFPSRQVLNAIR
ncbi:MAG TPA: DUF2459 domain-containing protein [Acidisoma sp.]|nr:DUF2459 domain-containing protein [Acidisoma sp.]